MYVFYTCRFYAPKTMPRAPQLQYLSQVQFRKFQNWRFFAYASYTDGPRTNWLLVLGVLACALSRYANFMPQKRGVEELIAALDCNFASVKLHLQSKAADGGQNIVFLGPPSYTV
jgi:hypothetical protein